MANSALMRTLRLIAYGVIIQMDNNNLKSFMTKIRLTDTHIENICCAFRRIFLANDHLWVFGSRADPSRKGGDIDLYIETSMEVSEIIKVKLTFLKELFFIFEGQKIDVVIRYKNAPNLLIYQQAKETGVQLV
jgi:hypothetical protein